MQIISDFEAPTGKPVQTIQDISNNSLECAPEQKKPPLSTMGKKHSAKRIKKEEIRFQARKEIAIGGNHASLNDSSKLAQQSSQVDEDDSRTREDTGEKKLSTVAFQPMQIKQTNIS